MKGFVCATLLLLSAGTIPLYAQEIEAKLSGSTASQGFTVHNRSLQSLFTVRGNGRIGMNISNPIVGLHLISNDGLLAIGSAGSGTTHSLGQGTRLHWYPKKFALRAGKVDGTHWDDGNIGNGSVALGWNAKAQGDYSTAMGIGPIATAMGTVAMGYNTEASETAATAFGKSTTASGNTSTAWGNSTTASGGSSTAMGFYTTASGAYSTSMGHNATASGEHSTAMGKQTTASATGSTAMGYQTTASGTYSSSMGSYVSTNNRTGTFMIGDASTTSMMNALTSNRFYARFNSGFILYTKADRSTGMLAGNGANSWTSFSDSTRKERYVPADAERMLSAFSTLRLGSWSYKGDDRRHYGPMAQEWFAAFGNDGIGTIGDDTTLATADVDGVLCLAVQALEKRTANNKELAADLERQLQDKNRVIEDLRNLLTERNTVFENRMDDLQRQISRQESIITQLVHTLHEQREVAETRFAE